MWSVKTTVRYTEIPNTYGTMPRVATAEGSDKIPTETFSAIMTVQTIRT